MIARVLISDSIPPLKVSDEGGKALQWMKEFGVTHLPIISNGNYKGLISEDELLDLNDPQCALKEYPVTFCKSSVEPDIHIFEVLDFVVKNKLSIIPVVDKDSVYLGTITLNSLAAQLAKMTSANEPGGVIVLRMQKFDYHLSQIASIVETYNVRILSAGVTSLEDGAQILVTLKLNSDELASVISNFERYDYIVEAVYGVQQFDEDISDRYDALMRFLNT